MRCLGRKSAAFVQENSTRVFPCSRTALHWKEREGLHRELGEMLDTVDCCSHPMCRVCVLLAIEMTIWTSHCQARRTREFDRCCVGGNISHWRADHWQQSSTLWDQLQMRIQLEIDYYIFTTAFLLVPDLVQCWL